MEGGFTLHWFCRKRQAFGTVIKLKKTATHCRQLPALAAQRRQSKTCIVRVALCEIKCVAVHQCLSAAFCSQGTNRNHNRLSSSPQLQLTLKDISSRLTPFTKLDVLQVVSRQLQVNNDGERHSNVTAQAPHVRSCNRSTVCQTKVALNATVIACDNVVAAPQAAPS